MIETSSGKVVDMMFGTGPFSYKDYGGLHSVIYTAIHNGIVGFDTAPSYKTEVVLGKCLKACTRELGLNRKDIFIQTKIDAWQMIEGADAIKMHTTDVLCKMGIDYLDSLLIHWPLPEYTNEAWEAFVRLQSEGIVRYIGICNLRMRQLSKISDCGCIPQIIQIERNPLRSCDAEINFCNAQGIAVQSYSPLCQMHEDIKNNALLGNMANKYGKSIGQIVLRWHLDSGAIPIFTSTKVARIKEYAAIRDFSLTRGEVEQVSMLNRNYKVYLESCACPGF